MLEASSSPKGSCLAELKSPCSGVMAVSDSLSNPGLPQAHLPNSILGQAVALGIHVVLGPGLGHGQCHQSPFLLRANCPSVSQVLIGLGNPELGAGEKAGERGSLAEWELITQRDGTWGQECRVRPGRGKAD